MRRQQAPTSRCKTAFPSRWTRALGTLFLAIGAVGAAWPALAAPPAGTFDFDVDFSGCAEYVGIGLVPAGPARALVPAAYPLVEVDGQAVLVVRLVTCQAVSVDGKPAKPARVAQVGVRVDDGLDPSADINNYTLFYATDLGKLKGKLKAAGAHVALDAQLLFALDQASGDLEGLVDAPGVPLLALEGTASAPNFPSTFVATWWVDGRHGQMRARTEFPAITFGAANASITTNAGSWLEWLIGPSPYGFALLDSYNTFESAPMTVQVAP